MMSDTEAVSAETAFVVSSVGVIAAMTLPTSYIELVCCQLGDGVFCSIGCKSLLLFSHSLEHTVCDMENLTFFAGVRACPLLAYADSPKENDRFSI